jgi:transcriptional regulator with XRE-family HTH domain
MRIAAQFGQRVRAIRRLKGLTQGEVAEVSGLDRAYWSHIEAGSYKPNLDTIVQVAQGLRVNLSELFEGIEIEDLWLTRKPKIRRLDKMG